MSGFSINPSWIKINYNMPHKKVQKTKDDITGGWFEGNHS